MNFPLSWISLDSCNIVLENAVKIRCFNLGALGVGRLVSNLTALTKYISDVLRTIRIKGEVICAVSTIVRLAELQVELLSNGTLTQRTWTIIHRRTKKSWRLKLSIDTCPFSIRKNCEHFVSRTTSNPLLCTLIIVYIRSRNKS